MNWAAKGGTGDQTDHLMGGDYLGTGKVYYERYCGEKSGYGQHF